MLHYDNLGAGQQARYGEITEGRLVELRKRNAPRGAGLVGSFTERYRVDFRLSRALARSYSCPSAPRRFRGLTDGLPFRDVTPRL